MIQHKLAEGYYMNVGERVQADALSILDMMTAIRGDHTLETGSIHAFICVNDKVLDTLVSAIDMLCVYHTLLYRVFKPIRGGYHNVELHKESCSLLVDGRHNIFLFSNADQFYKSQKSVRFDSYRFHNTIVTRINVGSNNNTSQRRIGKS